MNALQLPIRSESFDHAISIAVIHHFSTLSHRIQAVKGPFISSSFLLLFEFISGSINPFSIAHDKIFRTLVV